jgi:8-oxo-dGTP pyrophosphatase MutT (NUDIX family)
MIVYVAGFAFWKNQVVLVKKNKPSWQVELWNGVGGSVKDNETPPAAMEREFYEETGISISFKKWDHFATEIPVPDTMVHFYRYFLDEFTTPDIPAMNDIGETLAWIRCDKIQYGVECIGNLSWLVPLARDPRGLLRAVRVECRDDIKETPTW